ncbi:hypothetical protein FBU30_007649 [Linnemannia zychae]|nr:hypothetical protein FBU30_007649 [Linnemannia zychae]
MQSVGSFFSTVSKFYNEINPATLSGAIDVVVVEQANGDLACSPFHVRFGKLSILRPQEKVVSVHVHDFEYLVVEVTINGRVVDFPMKVGDAGEAFFVFETEQEVPEEFATSPLAGPSSPDKAEEEIDFLDLAQVGAHGISTPQELPNDQDTGYVSAHSGHGSEFEEDEQEILSSSSTKQQMFASAVQFGSYGTDHHRVVEGPFGDDSNTHVHFGYQPSTPVVVSDGANEHRQFLSPPKDDVMLDMTGYKTDDSAETDLESDDSPAGVGTSKSHRMRRKRMRNVRKNLEKLSGEPRVEPDSHRHRQHHHHKNSNIHPRRHSHKPLQQLQKPIVPRQNKALSALSDTELEYQTPRATKSPQDSEWSWGWGSLPVKNDSMDSMIDQDPKGYSSSHVSINIPVQAAPKPILNEIDIDGNIYKVAISICPEEDFGRDVVASEATFAMHQISFEEFGKDPLKIINNKSLVCLINDRYFTWAAAGPYLASLVLFRKPLSDETLHQLSSKDTRHLSDRSRAQEQPTRFGVLSRWLRGSTVNQLSTIEQSQSQIAQSSSAEGGLQANEEESEERHKEAKPKSVPENRLRPDNEPMARSTSMPIQHTKPDDKESSHVAARAVNQKRYAKTLRLTSDQLKSLNLKKGANTLTFSVTSSYQGKAVCTAKIFLWEHDYQVVISDIDGTITKSDALGHIFTMAGKDWTHTGVAKLYTDIANNGYHILYLTSRAIGQADYTRKYLKNVEQNNYQLPEGPVIMSPDRLMTAFHREVIMRKPEEFKMACLRDIRRLFEDRNPFYAGFGNRITDALSYRSVNVPSSRIFTIDSGGEVKLELLAGYKSSYLALNDLVNEIFPGKRHLPEFNDWNFWKPSMPIIDLPLAPSPQPTLSSNTTNLGSSGSTPGRLGVIRSFTSSLTSSSSLKKRPSIPAFSSSPAPPTSPQMPSSPSGHSPTGPSVIPPPPASAPAGSVIADRTRRLSMSLMKYGGSYTASGPETNATTSTLTQNTRGQNSLSPPSSTESTISRHNVRSRVMSMTTMSPGYIPSNLGTSPPTTSSDLLSDTHPLDIPSVKKASSFSVSPPLLASRLTETVIPFLRGRSSRSEQGQQQQEVDSLTTDNTSSHQQAIEILPRTDDYLENAVNEYQEEFGYSEDHYDAGEEGGEYDEYGYGDEELDGDLDDDVELNIDAPFL